MQLHQERTRLFLTRADRCAENSFSQQQITLLGDAHAAELHDKQQLINQLKAEIKELEQQSEKIRSLRRGTHLL